MIRKMIAAVFACVFAGQAGAVGRIADVTVFDRTDNRTLPVYHYEGRYYVAGSPGNEYEVNVRNTQSGSLLAVVSVDGVNAVSGETANWNQTGYVLSRYASYGIKGWRKSLQRTAAFYFTPIESSYAARTGRPDNVGVIGIAIFRSRAEPAVGRFDGRREAAAAGKAQNAQDNSPSSGTAGELDTSRIQSSPVPPSKEDRSLGTGHGRGETSIVRNTTFERATAQPDEVVSLYYDSYRNLVALGVIRDRSQMAQPDPFPARFVPDPR